MAVSVSYRTYLLEQTGRIRPVDSRWMFGGLCFFAGVHLTAGPHPNPTRT